MKAKVLPNCCPRCGSGDFEETYSGFDDYQCNECDTIFYEDGSYDDDEEFEEVEA